MGVLTLGSAHPRPSAPPAINTSRIFLVHMSANSLSNITPNNQSFGTMGKYSIVRGVPGSAYAWLSAQPPINTSVEREREREWRKKEKNNAFNGGHFVLWQRTQRASSIRGRIPFEVFNGRSSSIWDHLPFEVIFHWGSSSSTVVFILVWSHRNKHY